MTTSTAFETILRYYSVFLFLVPCLVWSTLCPQGEIIQMNLNYFRGSHYIEFAVV
jgi:hypothetical protein